VSFAVMGLTLAVVAVVASRQRRGRGGA
jgi:hypothetical protein